MSDPNELVTLANGGEAPKSAVTVLMFSLQDMAQSGLAGMLALHDLKEICTGQGKRVSPATIASLKERGLLESDGRPHDITRDVVLSAVKGEGLQTHLGSPYPEAPKKDHLDVGDKLAGHTVDQEMLDIMNKLGLNQKSGGRKPGE